jgi:hypothetical protein
MTALEMKYEFLLKADEIGILSNKSFTDAEIDWLLNDAQLELIRTRLNQNNPRGKGLEEDQKRVEDIKDIIIRYSEQPPVQLIYHSDVNTYELDLQSLTYRYYYFLSGRVTQHKDNCNYDAVMRRIRSHNFEDSLKDPFNMSSEEEVLVNFGRNSQGNGSAIYLYPAPNYTLSTARLSYIKYPKRIHQGTYLNLDGSAVPATDCELSELVHPEVVNIAVQKASVIMKDPLLIQSFQSQLMQQE